MRKTIIIFGLIISSLLLAGPIIASPVKANNAKETVRREITRSITCPEFVTENSALNEVKAIVSVNEAGIVSIEEINSGNEQLKEYVFNQLQNKKIKNSAAITEKFVLVVKFTVD